MSKHSILHIYIYENRVLESICLSLYLWYASIVSYKQKSSKRCREHRFCFTIGYIIFYFLYNQHIVFAEPHEKNKSSTEASEAYQRELQKNTVIACVDSLQRELKLLTYINKKYRALEQSCRIIGTQNSFLNTEIKFLYTMLNAFVTTVTTGNEVLTSVSNKIQFLTNSISAQKVLVANKLIQLQEVGEEEFSPMEEGEYQEWVLAMNNISIAEEILQKCKFLYVRHDANRLSAQRVIHRLIQTLPYCIQTSHVAYRAIPLRSSQRQQQIRINAQGFMLPFLDQTNLQPVRPSPAIVRIELENLKEALQKRPSSKHPPCSPFLPPNNYFSVSPSFGTIFEESEEESPSDDASNKAVYGSSESSSEASFDIFSEEEEETLARCQQPKHISASSSSPEDSDEEQTPTSAPHLDIAQGGKQQSSGSDDTACLTASTLKTQISSLQGLQHIFIGTIEQMADSLRTVVVIANAYRETKTFDTFTPYHPRHSVYTISNTTESTRSRYATGVFHLPIQNQSMSAIKQYYPFAYTRNVCSNLEYKTQAAKTGLVLFPTRGTQMAIGYEYHNPISLRYVDRNESDINPSMAEEKTKLNTLSATVGWNTNKIGMTGCLAGGYSWGKATHIRRGLHAQKDISVKGTPMITIYGGLAQVGYTVLVSKTMLLTPYVENLYLIGQWQRYQEQSVLSLSTISKNTENVWEKVVGLRYTWNIKREAQLQAWIGNIFVQQKMSTVTCRHCNPVALFYDFSVPARKKRYTQHELGMAYELNVTELLNVKLHGRVRCNPSKIGNNKQIRCILQYTY